jgi:hypothetical protein
MQASDKIQMNERIEKLKDGSKPFMINQNRCLQVVITFYRLRVGMEIIEMFGWIVLGFVPMLGGLEIASRKFGHTGKIVLRSAVVGGEV